MGTGKTYSTKYLLDSNNNSGVAGQVLSTTSTGIDWVDANTVPGSGLWLANGNDIYNSNSGNVGIGTTSPSNFTGLSFASPILDVAGVIQSKTGNIALGGTSYRKAALMTSTGTDDPYLDLRVATSGTSSNTTTRMRISANGNVGIGATNPLRKLHVVGQLAVNNATTEYYGVLMSGGEGADPSVLIGDWHNSSGTIKWDSTGNYLRIDSQHSTANAAILFSGNDGSTEYMRIASTGNVGIGTTSPGVKLEVASSSNPSIKIQDTTDGYAQKNSLIFDQKIVAAQTEVAKIYTELFNGATTTLNNPLKFATAQRSTLTMTDRMVIDNLGNVGIGTTSPISLLQVGTNLASDGVAYIGDYDSQFATNFFYRNQTAAQSTVPMMLIRQTNTGDDQPVLVLDQDGTGDILQAFTDTSQVVTIDYEGNVGIGNTSPVAKLDVSAGTNLNLGIRQLALDNFSNEGIGITFSRTSSDADLMAIGVVSTDKLGLFSRVGIMFLTGGSNQYAQTVERMRITHDGNVGIGTTSTGYKLEVVGSGYFTTTLRVDGDINFYDDLIGTSYKQGTTAIKNKRIKNIILESSVETLAAVVHPYFNNALGNFIAKGGTITFGNVTTPPSLAAQNAMFKPDQNFMSLSASNITASTWSMTLTSTNSGQMNFNYGCWIGITFGSSSFDPDSCKIEVNTNADGSGTWITALNSTVADTGYFTYYGSGGTGIKSIRFTMGQTSQDPRVCNIYAYNYAAAGMNEFFLSKAGGSVFGDIIPETDYLSGGTYLPKLGGSGNRWNEAYINKLADVNNSFGTSGQVLSSNSSGQLDWISGSGLPGGPYLPLAGGTMTGALTINLSSEGTYFTGGSGAIRQLSITSGTNISANALHTFNIASSNGKYEFDVNGTTEFSLDSSSAVFTGNVGIGTTSPVATLQVGSITATAMSQVVGKARIVGTNYIPSSTQMGTLDIASTTRNSSAPFNQGFGPSITFSQNISGYVDGYEVVIGAIKSIVTSGGNTGQESAMTFLVNGGTSTGVIERMRIAEDGNVGIGTTSPGSKLEISSTSDALLELNGGTTANPYMLFAQNGTRRAFIQYVNGGLLSLASEYGDIRFMTGTGGTETERMRIDSAGNVGIGTTGPSEKLEVQDGNIKIETTTNVDAELILNPYSSALGTTYQWELVGKNSANNYNFQIRENGTPYVTIDSSVNGNAGYVGIGTTSPGEKLSVTGNIEINVGAASAQGLIFNENGTQTMGIKYQGGQSGNPIDIFRYQDNTTKVRFLENGNVGIGKTNPAVPLDVEGKIRSNDSNSGDHLEIFCDGSVSGDSYIKNTNNNIQIKSASSVIFSTSNTTALTLDTSQDATFAGNVKLGPSSSVQLDDTPTASTASGSGTVVNWSVSETVTAGTLYAVKTNGGWTTADADSEPKSTYMLAIALGSNATAGMLLQGFFYKSSHGFTIGAPLYISNTAGAFSNSRPTGSGDYVRIIGYATSTNYIYFDPDKTWVKIA